METFEDMAGYLQLCMQLDKYQTNRTKGPHDEPYVIEHIYGVVVSTGSQFPGERHGLPGFSTPPCDMYVDVKIRRTRLALVTAGRELNWYIGGGVGQYVINLPESWEKVHVPGGGADIYRPRFAQPRVAPTACGRDGRPGPLRHLGPPENHVPPQPVGASVSPFDLFSFKYGCPGSGIFSHPPPDPRAVVQEGPGSYGPPTPDGRSGGAAPDPLGDITERLNTTIISVDRLFARTTRVSEELEGLKKDIKALQWHNRGVGGPPQATGGSDPSRDLF
jgi:hypothetical protein